MIQLNLLQSGNKQDEEKHKGESIFNRNGAQGRLF